jgi:hypothetical protein
MLLESRAHGLILEPAWNNHSLSEEPLGLVFPLVPDEDPSKQHQPLEPWIFQYKNGIQIEMVDIRSSHRHGNLQAGKKKVMQRRTTRRKNQTDDTVSAQSYPLTHTISEQPRKSSWKDRFRLGRKSSRSTLALAPPMKDSDIDSLWAPSVKDEFVELGPRPHAVQINSGPALRSLFSAPRQVFNSKGLVGYLDNSESLILWCDGISCLMLTTLSYLEAPCGTIIHPSVYFVCDVYDRVGLAGDLNSYFEGLNDFRQSCFHKHVVQGNAYMDPWRATLSDIGGPELKNCRVLVCGRAGVGKSTLINKVFGTVVVSRSALSPANRQKSAPKDFLSRKLTV